jgi:hypothetical protein
MTKTIVLTIAIWGLGIGSAAALVTTLSRRPTPVAEAPAPPPPVVAEIVPNIEHFKIPKPIAVAPEKVRSHLRLPTKPAKPKKDMRCTGWRPLQIGPIDRGVRYCQ